MGFFIYTTNIFYATNILVERLLSKAILPSLIFITTVPPLELKTVSSPFTVTPRLSRCFFTFSSAAILTTFKFWLIGANTIGIKTSSVFRQPRRNVLTTKRLADKNVNKVSISGLLYHYKFSLSSNYMNYFSYFKFFACVFFAYNI